MFQVKGRRHLVIPLAITIQMLAGCDDENARVAQVAQEAAQRQAAQNQEVMRLNREVAEGTRQLVQSRGEADKQLLAQQRNVQEQRDQLDHERQSITSERRRESLLSSTLLTVGELAVCSLPLVLCWLLLARLAKESAETHVNELLVDHLITERDSSSPTDLAAMSTEASDVAKLAMTDDR